MHGTDPSFSGKFYVVYRHLSNAQNVRDVSSARCRAFSNVARVFPAE